VAIKLTIDRGLKKMKGEPKYRSSHEITKFPQFKSFFDSSKELVKDLLAPEIFETDFDRENQRLKDARYALQTPCEIRKNGTNLQRFD